MKKRWIVFFIAVALLLAMLPTAFAVSSFSDVPNDAWYVKDVSVMQEKGLLYGYPDGSFRPNGTITRAEFISVVARVLGISSEGSGANWADDNIAAVRDQKNCWVIWDFSGFNVPITREEAISVIILAILPDADQGDWNATVSQIQDFKSIRPNYQYLVEKAYANGISNGYPDGTFRPTSTLTRAEACALIHRVSSESQPVQPVEPNVPTVEPDVPTAAECRKGGVSENGWLQVRGTQLCNEEGEAVALHGMSSHGIQWFGSFTSKGAIAATADAGANVFRVAMYVGENGYLSNPDKMQSEAFAAVDRAIAEDLYVILDWHILNGDTANPRNYQTQAIAFFKNAASRYKNTPNVLFEICNEPNGSVTWNGDVKPYAEAVTVAIRDIAPKNIILIGSPTWSQDVDIAASNPVKGTNLMYTCHFYSGTHGKDLQNKISKALSLGAPIFISEWGTSSASGDGGPYLTQASQWLDFLAKNGISWCNWSLCDKSETSAALKPGASVNGGWTEAQLTQSGSFVIKSF